MTVEELKVIQGLKDLCEKYLMERDHALKVSRYSPGLHDKIKRQRTALKQLNLAMKRAQQQIVIEIDKQCRMQRTINELREQMAGLKAKQESRE